MVDGFPYKEEVGGSSPSVPTILLNGIAATGHRTICGSQWMLAFNKYGQLSVIHWLPQMVLSVT